LTELITAICTWADQCQPITFQATYGDVDSCARVEEPRTTGVVPDAQLEACTQAIETGSCGNPGLGTAACDFHGTVPIGGTCSETQLCVPGAGCNYGATLCGTCVAYVSAGQPCEGQLCAPGFVCAPNPAPSGEMQCVALIDVSGACTASSAPCNGNLVCFGGTCSPPLEPGASCAQNGDACDGANSVTCTDGTCVAPALAKVGEPCGQVSGAGMTACIGFEVACVPTDDAGASTCVAPLAAGSACDASSGARCLFPTICANGVCAEQQSEDAGTCQ
jgi:hypothetical protein